MSVLRQDLLDKYKLEVGHELNIEVANRILFDIKEILDRAEIPFWLWCGTFLGIYREGRLLPWDGDIDLAVYAEDEAKIMKVEEDFTQKGFEIGTGHMLFLYRDGEHADIDLFRRGEDKRIYQNYIVDAIAFETPNTIEFLGKSWRIVSNPERWLVYLYTDDWRTPVKGLVPSGPLGV